MTTKQDDLEAVLRHEADLLAAEMKLHNEMMVKLKASIEKEEPLPGDLAAELRARIEHLEQTMTPDELAQAMAEREKKRLKNRAKRRRKKYT